MWYLQPKTSFLAEKNQSGSTGFGIRHANTSAPSVAGNEYLSQWVNPARSTESQQQKKSNQGSTDRNQWKAWLLYVEYVLHIFTSQGLRHRKTKRIHGGLLCYVLESRSLSRSLALKKDWLIDRLIWDTMKVNLHQKTTDKQNEQT